MSEKRSSARRQNRCSDYGRRKTASIQHHRQKSTKKRTIEKRKSHHGGCSDTSHRSIGLSGILVCTGTPTDLFDIGLIPGDGIGREVIPVCHSLEVEGIKGGGEEEEVHGG